MLVRLILILAIATAAPVQAGDQPPPPITGYGMHYQVPAAQTIPTGTRFKVAFDVADPAEVGQLNFNINSLARFLNMHVSHGVPAENIELALVVHGEATLDMLANEHYQAKYDQANATEDLIKQLSLQGVKVYLCGQSATHFGVTPDNMIPEVTLALSAMTAHAQLQQQGYTLNPF